jgi:hypothetical protein
MSRTVVGAEWRSNGTGAAGDAGAAYGGGVDGARPAWLRALRGLPAVRNGRWAVGGSACLALPGLLIDPRDVDGLADQAAVAELVAGLGDTVVMDQAPWDRNDVRAARRVLAVVEGVELEILVGVEAVASDGRVVLTTPNLDLVEVLVLYGKAISVLPLSTMWAVLEATAGLRHEGCAFSGPGLTCAQEGLRGGGARGLGVRRCGSGNQVKSRRFRTGWPTAFRNMTLLPAA